MVRRRKVWVLLIAFLAIGGSAVLVLFSGPSIAERHLEELKGDANRGSYIARLAGCIACHTNAKKGGGFLAGGTPIKTPFGTFYAPNITPNPEDGIGKWSLRDFSRAVTAGIRPDGAHYYPVFLYPNYTRMSDQDIADLWAAMKTVPPVSGKAPKHEISFPFNQRILLGAWKTLFFSPGAYNSDPSKSDIKNRGEYIVNGPAHCVACHSPINAFGGRDYGHDLAGNSNGPNGEKVPPINAKALKKNGWTKDDIVFALRTAATPKGDALGGSMGEVVRDSTAWLSDDDLKAIAEYLLSAK
jgi:mono/diheme cytochrome c family protein